MPIYQFECPHCNTPQEHFVPRAMQEGDTVECPVCHGDMGPQHRLAAAVPAYGIKVKGPR
jgi:putative FmdB family regulatory protein